MSDEPKIRRVQKVVNGADLCMKIERKVFLHIIYRRDKILKEQINGKSYVFIEDNFMDREPMRTIVYRKCANGLGIMFVLPFYRLGTRAA